MVHIGNPGEDDSLCPRGRGQAPDHTLGSGSGSAPMKDPQTVTPEGDPIGPRIHGLEIRRALPRMDDRGELIEMYRPSWLFHPDPLVYVYEVVLRPGSIRAWVVHHKQDDRVFVSRGAQRWAFYDDRAASPTRGLLNVFTWSDRNRVLFTTPAGVYHGVQCLGPNEGSFVNMPTRPYDHADPDKVRLPLKNDLIRYEFPATTGG
jgi:dTDP-4-dehydrorhamnose 3,5-epimerase